MKYFERVHEGLDVAPMLAELDARPELWDQHPERRTAPDSPHAGMTDIWLRARDYADIGVPNAFREPHAPVFYPAWTALPALQPVVWALMGMTKSVQLGNVLVTRIPPGGAVLPHVDTGWAVDWFAEKFYVLLRANLGCVNTCLDEAVTMAPGEIWRFENRLPHGVQNNGESERIALIATMRVEA